MFKTPVVRSKEALASQGGPSPRPAVEPCFLGFGLVIALSTSASLFTGASPALSALPSLGWLTNTARVVVFLACALIVGGGHRLPARTRLGWVAGICATIGIATSLIAPLAGGGTMAVNTAGVAVMAVGHALLYLLWLELYARMDLPHVLMYFSLVHLVSAALSFVLSLVSAAWFVAITLVALPLASSWLLATSIRRSSDAPFMQGETPRAGWSFPIKPVVLLASFTFANSFVRHFLTVDLRGMALLGPFMQGETPRAGWSFPIKPVVLLASFTFANSFVRHFLTVDLRGMALLGVIAAACLVLALQPILNRRGIQPLYALAFPLVIAGSLCVLVALPGFGTVGALLTNAAYTLFSIFVTVLLCSISYRYGVNALWLFGYAQAAVSLGSLGANLLGTQVDFVAHDPALLTLTVAAVVVAFSCLSVTFGGDRDRAEAWGIVQTGTGEHAPADKLEERCARLARQHGLTRREEEVVLLLVQGVPFSQIETDLCVSNSTLKTHARHIYAKVGVAGRKELGELVEGEG